MIEILEVNVPHGEKKSKQNFPIHREGGGIDLVGKTRNYFWSNGIILYLQRDMDYMGAIFAKIHLLYH